MPRALIHQSSSGSPISPNRRRATLEPCGLRSYLTTEVVRARTRAVSLNSSGTFDGQGCRRQAAYRGALTKFTISASFAKEAYAFWEPIFKRAGPHVKMLTRISDPEMES